MKMGIRIYFLLAICCCLAATTGSRSASLSTPKPTNTDGATGIPEVRKPVLDLDTMLKFKNVRANICDWGCNANKDMELELCETKCDIDFSHAFDQQKQCQELCAVKYLQCLKGCANYKVVKK